MYIAFDAYRKIFNYAQLAKDKEVIGLLVISEQATGGLLIEDVLLPKQEVSGGSCTMLPDKDITDYIEKSPDKKIMGWWHSHINMGTFHSCTDDSTLNGWGGGKVPYAVSLVVSLPNELKAWIQYFTPIEIDKAEVDLKVLLPDEDKLVEKCKAELEAKLTERKYEIAKSEPWSYMGPQTDLSKQTGGEVKSPLYEEDSGVCANLVEGKSGQICFFLGRNFNCATCTRQLGGVNANCMNYELDGFTNKPSCIIYGSHINCLKCEAFDDGKEEVKTECPYALENEKVIVKGEEGCTLFGNFSPCKSCTRINQGVVCE